MVDYKKAIEDGRSDLMQRFRDDLKIGVGVVDGLEQMKKQIDEHDFACFISELGVKAIIDVKTLVNDTIANINGIKLPDGSGVFIGSFPLPKDHWLTRADEEEFNGPYYEGVPAMAADIMWRNIRDCVERGLRSATAKGTVADFDPDALLQNIRLNLFGSIKTLRADSVARATP